MKGKPKPFLYNSEIDELCERLIYEYMGDDGAGKPVDIISNAAMTKKYCSPSVSHSDNMRYSFRVWLLNLGLIGDEYKNCRTHLLKHLTGDIAWRHPEDGVAQHERLRQERIATRSQVERASVGMPNDGMPAREQEQRNESPCNERVAAVCDDRQEVEETTR